MTEKSQNKKERLKDQWRKARLKYYNNNHPERVISDIVKAKKEQLMIGIPVDIESIIEEIRKVLENMFKRFDGGSVNG